MLELALAIVNGLLIGSIVLFFILLLWLIYLVAKGIMGWFKKVPSKEVAKDTTSYVEPKCECGGPRYVGTVLGKYTVQCECGIIWEDEWGGPYRFKNQELARDPKLQHSYSTDPEGSSSACSQCDASYTSEEGRQPCLNPMGNKSLTRFLKQSGWVQHREEELDESLAVLKQISEKLPRQPCPKCQGQEVGCGLCGGSGVIGDE